MSTELEAYQAKIFKCFRSTFGRTSLSARQKDILGEALEVSRFTDIKNLRSEMGQLLCSVLAGISECDWDAKELINETIELIESRKEQYLSLSRKKKVALLGGAFDPITKGHIEVAQFVLNASGEFDEVWLTPCYQHMYNKEMAPPKDRVEMCKLATENDKRIKVFTYEIENKFAGETYHLVNRLMNDAIFSYTSTHNFSMIIGQDNANTFDKWYNYKELEKLIRFVVVPRAGIPTDFKVDWYLNPPHIYLRPDDPIMTVSSTMVREHLRCGTANNIIKDFVDEKVLDYINEHGLYRNKS